MTIATTVADRITAALASGNATDLVALYAPGALIDINVPEWRWQIAGAEAHRFLDEGLLADGRECRLHRVSPTSDGLIVEEETHFNADGERRKFRQIHVYRIDDGKIVEEVVYCSGIWDAATIARQAVEAPMIRP